MRKRCATALIALGCAATLAACGSGSSSQSSSATAAKTGSSGSATAPAGNGEATKPATQILSDAARALRSARSYELEALLSEHHRIARLRVVTAPGNSLELSEVTGPAAYQVISVPSGTFARGNIQFWRQKDARQAGLLANRWIRLPAGTARALLASFAELEPANLSRCLVEDRGRLTLAGRTTVAGRPALVIKDAGNVPGGQPGQLDVAASGTPYPLRYLTTAPGRAGGRVDVCNNGKASAVLGDLTFSQFDQVRAILAPAGVE